MKKLEVGDVVKIKAELEPDSRIKDFAGKKVVVLSVFDNPSGFAFCNHIHGLGAATINAIDDGGLQEEIDMLNAYLELEDFTLSSHAIETIARYIVEKVRGK